MPDPRRTRPTQRDSATKLVEGLGDLERRLRQYADASPVQTEIAERRRRSERVEQAVAAEKRAAVEREEATLAELTATRLSASSQTGWRVRAAPLASGWPVEL